MSRTRGRRSPRSQCSFLVVYIRAAIYQSTTRRHAQLYGVRTGRRFWQALHAGDAELLDVIPADPAERVIADDAEERHLHCSHNQTRTPQKDKTQYNTVHRVPLKAKRLAYAAARLAAAAAAAARRCACGRRR